LFRKRRSKVLTEQIVAALKADLEDSEYQVDIQLWDVVVGDGLDA
jgi:hypothetical protein